MTVVEAWLKDATHQLNDAGIESARLDALILLEDILSTNRAHLLAHPETELDNEQVDELEAQIKRRINHEPLAYIRGHNEFYGRNFMVNAHVLIPRPESEAMIDLLKALPKVARITDVGTGSGCLGITAALELPGSTVLCTDIDENCLAIARTNAQRHGVAIETRQGDLLTGSPDLVLANLPYVPVAHPVNQAAQHEPAQALYGGPDGLDLYRRLFKNLTCSYVITEAMPDQQAALAEIARKACFYQQNVQGCAQLFVTQPLPA